MKKIDKNNNKIDKILFLNSFILNKDKYKIYAIKENSIDIYKFKNLISLTHKKIPFDFTLYN